MPNLGYHHTIKPHLKILTSKNKIKSTSSNNFNNSSNLFKDSNFIEKEISRKVDQYRLSLNQELLIILSEERQKEDNRERTLAEVEDDEERNKLEKLFGLERNQASYKIVNFNK